MPEQWCTVIISYLKSIFSGFKSRCTIFLECNSTKAFMMHLIITAASLSLYYPFWRIRSKSSPPFKCSKTKWTLFIDSYTSQSLIMFSWSNFRNIDTSSNNDYFIKWIELNPYKITLAFAEHSFLDSLNCKCLLFVANQRSLVHLSKVALPQQVSNLIVTFKILHRAVLLH